MDKQLKNEEIDKIISKLKKEKKKNCIGSWSI